MIAFFKKVRKSIFEKYKEILSGDPMIEVDAAVLDDSRVCRLPGTYNMKAGRYCRLISVSGMYYELSDLVQGCNLWDWKSEEEYKKVKEDKEDKESFSPPSSSLSCNAAATEEEVKAYASEIGAGCDVSVFYQTMQEQGWRSGGKPVRSWKAIFRAWEAKDKQKRESDRQSENAEAYESFIYNE